MSRKRQLCQRKFRLCHLERRDVPSSSIPLNQTSWTALGPTPLLNAQTPGNLPATGRASAVAVHPTDGNTIYVGTAGGGVWKTTNGGAANPDWTPITDGQLIPYIGAVALAPSSPNTVYVGTGEASWSQLSYYGKGIYKSLDGGANWVHLGQTVFDRVTISTIIVHPTDPNTVFAAVGSPGIHGNAAQPTGIFRSTDGGVNWTNISAAVTTVDGYSDLERDPTNINVMFACVGTRNGGAADGVYKTTNALAATPTWTAVAGLPTGSTVGRTEMAIAPSNNQTMYVSMHDPATAGLFRFYVSTNGGGLWTDRTANVPALGSMWYGNNLIVDLTAPNTLYIGGSTGLTRTVDAGLTFPISPGIATGTDGKGPHVDHHAFALDPTNRFITVSDGGIYRYTPATNLWVSLNGVNSGRATSTAINTIQFIGIAIHPTDPDTAFGGTQDNGLDRFSDSSGWTLTEGGDGGDPFYDPFNPSRMFRANPVASYGSGAFVRRSTNGGDSWTAITTGIVNASAAAFYLPMVADPGTNDRLLLGTTVLNVSTNGGSNWGTLPGDTFTFPSPTRAIGIGAASASTIYVSCGPNVPGTANAGEATQIFVTTNNGVTWTERTPALNANFHAITVDPTNSNIAYAVNGTFSAAGDNLYRTTNGGVNWVSIGGALPDMPCYDVVIDPGPTGSSSDDVLYAGGDFGVYRSADLGVTWTKFGTSLPAAQVRDLEFAPATKILAAGTHGRGVWEILTGTPTTPGFIAGTVYNDVDGDGAVDAGEPGLAGWTVYRDDNNNGVLDTGSTTTVNSTNVPVPLPEVGTASSTLSVSGLVGTIADINVKLNITHTYDGDFTIYLTSPTGTKLTMFSHVGGSGQNFTDTVLDDEATTFIANGSAPFTGSFQPAGVLAAFDGQAPNGTWTLSYDDPNMGDSGTLNSWSVTIQTGEARTISAASGAYQFLNQASATYNVRRQLQAGWTGTQPIANGATTVTLTPTVGAFSVNFGQTNTPAKIASVSVNDGSAQRSRVTQLVVTFNSIVNFAGAPADAFQLVRTGPGSPSGVPNGVVTLAAATTNAGFTAATLTFSGSVTEFQSLMDGRYTLTVFAAQFTGAGFDGDGNGVANDNYTLVGDPMVAPKLFRLFGDSDGDGTVAVNDFNAFRMSFGGTDFEFDFDGDGSVSNSDFNRFRDQFGSTI